VRKDDFLHADGIYVWFNASLEAPWPAPRRFPHHIKVLSVSFGPPSTLFPAIMTNFRDPKVEQADARAPPYLPDIA
jgi:hypothetical protein